MPTKPRTLYIIDGSGYIFRAYFAIRPLYAADGTPTHALLGYARMLNKLIHEEQPEYLMIAFDTRGKNFRHQLYPLYKAHRESPPEDLTPQIPLILKLTTLMRIHHLSWQGFEADDIIASVTAKAVAAAFKVVIVSGDKDLSTLVDQNVEIYDPMKDTRLDVAAIQTLYGVHPRQFIDVLALAGDSSDNIPGVPRVGLKTAAKWVAEHGNLDAIITAFAKQNKRKVAEEAVLVHQDTAYLCQKLVRLVNDIPIDFTPEQWRYTGVFSAQLIPFLENLQMHSLAETLTNPGNLPGQGLPQQSLPHQSLNDKVDPHPQAFFKAQHANYQTITQFAQLASLLKAAQQHQRISIDLETSNLNPRIAEIVGLAIKVPHHHAAYVPVGHHYLGAPSQLALATVLTACKEILEDPNIQKVGQNLKYDINVLRRYNIDLKPVGDDAMVAAYVVDATSLSFSLDALSRRYLQHETITFQQVMQTSQQQNSFADVHIAAATTYAAEDAEVADALCTLLAAQVEDHQMTQVYRDIELPLISVLAAMEDTGIMLDIAYLQQLQQEFNSRLKQIYDQAIEMIGKPINLSSPKQLAELFFQQMGLPPIKKTKTGLSTDQSVLEVLAKIHPLPQLILSYRGLEKLKTTYIDALLKIRDPISHRVHTHFNQALTHTGRLSSSNPNLQNIPIRSEDGLRIRKAFIAPPQHVLISADYSQIELRILAHLSEDPAMIAAFARNDDIHQLTADAILQHMTADSTQKRRIAKAINFGIVYGQTPFGLATQLHIGREQARIFIENYFQRYQGVRQYMENTIAKARKEGFVCTMTGRRRYIPLLNSQNKTQRQAAERIAMNTPIQGSAADLIKMAMIAVAQELKQKKMGSRLLLQVHDELVLEVPLAETHAVQIMLQQWMSQIVLLKVPLEIVCKVGTNWGIVHPN